MKITAEQELEAFWTESIGDVGRQFMDFRKLSHLTVKIARKAISRTARKVKFCPEIKNDPLRLAKYCSTVGKNLRDKERERHYTKNDYGVPPEWLAND